MDLLARGPCSSLDIIVRPERWTAVAQALGMESVAVIPPGLAVIECDGTALDELFRRVRWILQAAALYPGCFERREIARMVEVGIVWQLLALLDQPLQRKFMLPSMARRREAVANVAALPTISPRRWR